MKSKDNHPSRIIHDHGPLGFVSFVAYVGALVYFIEQSQGFWEVVLAFLKAAVWPGFVVYHALKALGA
jgi:hypothetical protein